MDDTSPDPHNKRLEYYCAKEREALDNANRSLDPHMRQTWLNVAQNWRFLAEHLQSTF
jgi:hypothetical protein